MFDGLDYRFQVSDFRCLMYVGEFRFQMFDVDRLNMDFG
jgi:hypothetical protein